jgi:hypothetical protein
MSSLASLAVQPELDQICARCLSPVRGRPDACPQCDTSFLGNGRFELLGGTTPSRDFAFMFRDDGRDFASRVAAADSEGSIALRSLPENNVPAFVGVERAA